MSNDDPLSGIFEEGKINEGPLSDAEVFGKNLYEMLNTVLEIITKIWDIIRPLFSSIFSFITSIINLINPLIDLVKPFLNDIIDIIGGVIKTLSGIIDMITFLISIFNGDWDRSLRKAGEGFKNFWQGIMDIITSALNFIISAVNLVVVKPLNLIFKIFGFQIESIPKINSPQLFGGINSSQIETPNLSSASNITPTSLPNFNGESNYTSLKRTGVEMLYEWGGGFGNNEEVNIVLNLDGSEIARSKKFTEEFNRRNSGFNIK